VHNESSRTTSRSSRAEEGRHVFSSETDSEVFAHLISAQLKNGDGCRRGARRDRPVKGTYALV